MLVLLSGERFATRDRNFQGRLAGGAGGPGGSAIARDCRLLRGLLGGIIYGIFIELPADFFSRLQIADESCSGRFKCFDT